MFLMNKMMVNYERKLFNIDKCTPNESTPKNEFAYSILICLFCWLKHVCVRVMLGVNIHRNSCISSRFSSANSQLIPKISFANFLIKLVQFIYQSHQIWKNSSFILKCARNHLSDFSLSFAD